MRDVGYTFKTKHYMYKLIALILCSITLFSCGRSFHNYRIPATHPHVTLKNGQEIETRKVVLKGKGNKQWLVTDTAKYWLEDIAFYSDNIHRYANVYGAKFATLEFGGKINVYRRIKFYPGGYYPDGRYSSGAAMHTFIQNGDTGRVVRFSAMNLKPMIPASTPAGKIMTDYFKIRRKTTIGLVGGITLGIAAIVFTASENNKPDHSNFTTTAGGIFIGAFLATAVTSLVIKGNNGVKKNKALEIYEE